VFSGFSKFPPIGLFSEGPAGGLRVIDVDMGPFEKIGFRKPAEKPDFA